MGRYFGTDGVRGKANETLMVERAYKVGRYLGYYYSTAQKGHILIGKDTRLSGDMLEHALAAGASASGADVTLLGVCPTPAVAWLIRQADYDCGVMISASHNPYYDNGIKVFNHDGLKLDATIEALIEDYLDDLSSVPYAVMDEIGKINSCPEELRAYLDYLKQLVDYDLSDMKILLDLANGSATSSAVQVLSALNAQLTVINGKPDGININTHCGSTHPETMMELMKTGQYQIGLAFDGDADRLIACDETGNLVDGDKALYVLGKSMRAKGLLKDDMIVTTVMANLGLYKLLEKEQLNYQKTAVGDKNVYECMVTHDYKLGGEQSGHIIFKDLATTGDGLLTALKLIEVMKESGKPLSELCAPLHIYPQLLINVPVNNKLAAQEDEEVLTMVDAIAKQLGDNGRILVRPSGTEPLIRVMVEAESDEICARYVNEVVDLIKSKGL